MLRIHLLIPMILRGADPECQATPSPHCPLAACEVGYIEASDPFNYRMAVADLIQTAAEPALFPGEYEFASSQLSTCLRDKLLYLRNNHDFQRIPPADVIFLHRKLAGIFLLCARINARVDVRTLLLEHLEQQLDQ